MSGRTTLSDLLRLAQLHEQAALADFGKASEDARQLDQRIAVLTAIPFSAEAAPDLTTARTEANWMRWRVDVAEKLREQRKNMQPALDELRAAAAKAVGRKAALEKMIAQTAKADRQNLARRNMAKDQG